MRLAAVALSVLGLVACSRSRVHFTASERISAAHRVAVVAGAWMLERTSDGKTRQREDWSDAAVRALLDAARSELERRGVVAVTVENEADVRGLLDGLVPVVDAVGVRGYGISGGEHVLEEGDYVVSGVEPLLDRSGADLLLVALAGSEVVRWKIMGGSSTVNDSLSLALLDRGGRVVWYNSSPPTGEDMTAKVLRRSVAYMLKELPVPRQ